MGDFNHGHIQWISLESTMGEDQQFLFLIQDNFRTQQQVWGNRNSNDYNCSSNSNSNRWNRTQCNSNVNRK